jgi:hypothetical protein
VEMREEGADRQVFTRSRWLARSLPPGEFEKRARIPIQAFLQTISVVPMGLVSVTLHDPGAEAPGYFHRVPTGHEIANLSGGAETPGVHSGGMRYNTGSVLHRSSAEVSRMFDRITFERNMMGGRACIRGIVSSCLKKPSPSLLASQDSREIQVSKSRPALPGTRRPDSGRPALVLDRNACRPR